MGVRKTFAAVTTLALFTAAGCGLFAGSADQTLRKSPSFRQGYADGCAAAATPSANYREGPVRDEALYNSDRVYRAGWANGYATCRPQSTPVPDSNPAAGSIPR